ncbi:MAG TPA: peptide-methionine (S)-S-oxide reductase MsrA [Candidatus Nanoarchaeia archaeon]|nr:peptide-methionine (S)-S-oxide reductase MsrA [Candidatus Nanoarchaeia archaeon]
MIETATFGAGCFWHVEESFRNLKGVSKTAVGYMGGKMKNPSYEDVCTDSTGHVEVCQVEFDPEVVSYGRLLEVFWGMHDSTQSNRQGPDIGTQYKSVIFYHDDKQKSSAAKSKVQQQKSSAKKIVTELLPATEFYKAEDYHQKYLMKHGRNVC